jgi:hypothetical protein
MISMLQATRLRLQQIINLSAFSLLCALSGQVGAVIITYDYEIDTPTFQNPPFGPLNTLLANAGSAIIGTVTYDTSKVSSSISGVDSYERGVGFTHTGELDDTVGFDSLAGTLGTNSSTNNLLDIFFWEILGDPIYQFGITFPNDFWPGSARDGVLEAYCYSEVDACNGDEFADNLIAFSGTLTRRVNGAPSPSGLALLGIGLVALRFRRLRN